MVRFLPSVDSCMRSWDGRGWWLETQRMVTLMSGVSQQKVTFSLCSMTVPWLTEMVGLARVSTEGETE